MGSTALEHATAVLRGLKRMLEEPAAPLIERKMMHDMVTSALNAIRDLEQ